MGRRGRAARRIEVVLPDAPPRLTPRAARLLLEILRDAAPLPVEMSARRARIAPTDDAEQMEATGP